MTVQTARKPSSGSSRRDGPAMAENNPLPTGIRRIDNPLTRTHSWHVSVQRRGKIITRHFSDGVYGGKQKSYQEALAFLQAAGQSQQRMLRREYADILRKNNASGVPGVSRHQSGGKEYWNARWPTAAGQHKSAKFSVAKYGDQKAFELALAARRSGLECLNEPYNNIKHSKRSQGYISLLPGLDVMVPVGSCRHCLPSAKT